MLCYDWAIPELAAYRPMIKSLHINNYKSLHDLTLDVGRFNVLIGENGCGKSNVLEAIALAGAAAADKLDNEFLVSRGIRVTEPQLMRAAFSEESLQEPIEISVGFENVDAVQKYLLNHDNQAYSSWARNDSDLTYIMNVWMTTMQLIGIHKQIRPFLLHQSKAIDKATIEENKTKKMMGESIASEFFGGNKKDANKYFEGFDEIYYNEAPLKNVVIYSPENTALRNFQKEGQIQPLGINGEGLLKLLKVIQSKSTEQRAEIHESLELFDWYEQLDIPKELAGYEDKVTITDRFLSRDFDQRSANEGFLFVLFYIALMVSDDTPKIFAVDNIDAALNPKLCTQLIKELTRLAKKYDKQVFVTTHNPAILDGIDLGDDEQRLLVLSRNKQGHTRCKRIGLDDKPRSASNEPLKLSEAFLRGYLGGLPKGF